MNSIEQLQQTLASELARFLAENPALTGRLQALLRPEPASEPHPEPQAPGGPHAADLALRQLQVQVENDGGAERTFVVRATESSESGWTVVYRAGASDITAEETGGSRIR